MEAAGNECRPRRTRSARLRAILHGLSTRDDTAHAPGKHGADPQASESSMQRPLLAPAHGVAFTLRIGRVVIVTPSCTIKCLGGAA